MKELLENIKGWFSGIVNTAKEKKALHKKEDAIRRSMELFQVREYNKELWFIYDNELVCPMTMVEKMPVDTLYAMRKLFVERTCNKEVVAE